MPLRVCVHPVGFEPTHPKITELESAALDQLGHECFCGCGSGGKQQQSNNRATQQSNWLPWLSRQSGRLLTDRSPVRARVGARGRVAQSVEHWSNKPTVAGSIPVTTSDTLAEWLRRQPAKLLGFSRTGWKCVGGRQLAHASKQQASKQRTHHSSVGRAGDCNEASSYP